MIDSEPVVRPTEASGEAGCRLCPSLSLDEDARVDLGGVFVACLMVDGRLETGTQLQNKIEPEDQWSYKRSPDYGPGVTTTMKKVAIATRVLTWPKQKHNLCR